MNGPTDPAGDPGSPVAPVPVRTTRLRLAVVAGVGVLLLALLGPGLLTSRLPTPTGPTPTGAAPSGPAATAGQNPAPTAPGPTPTAEPWAVLAVPPYEPVADLAPSDRDRLGIAADTTFEVRSRNGTPAADLAAGLTVRPAVAFAIEPGADPSRVVVRPARALEPGARYRWELTATDGSLAGSWLFTVRQPLHVVSTLPGDKAVGVPPNTGIEFTFDQDGATGVADRVSISPATRGRFEQHGRTWAFVPEQPLAERTIYTVTVRAGIGASGSEETLESDVTFRFETGTKAATPPRVEFERPILESRPGAHPVVLLTSYDDEEEESATPAGPYTVDVYRLASYDAAVGAARRLTGSAGWAVASPDAVVDTADLERVERVRADELGGDYGTIVRIPVSLSSGWYILQIAQPGGPAQLLLQVTNVGAYALLTSESLVVWVTGLASEAPLAGATIRVIGGDRLGVTGANGTLKVPAPEGLLAATALLGVRTADGRSLIVGLGLAYSWTYDEIGPGWGAGGAYWTLFRTDRDTYRRTDTIHVSGLVRARSDRSVPDRVTVQLLPEEGDADVPILAVPVAPSARATFVADLPLVDLPWGEYRVRLMVGDRLVAYTWVNVAEIRKPAYEIDVSTDRLAYVVGDPVQVSSTTTFYDGTATPGLELGISGFGGQAQSTTDAAGHAGASLVAGWEDEDYRDEGSVNVTTVGISPLRPEEGQISGYRDVGLFPSRVWITAKGVLNGTRVIVDGNLTWADITAWEAAFADGEYIANPAGGPIVGRALTATVYRYVERRTQVGTHYDYIEKKVVPLYEVDYDRVKVGTYPMTSGAAGAFHLAVQVPSATDGYEVVVTATDPENRPFVGTFHVERPNPPRKGLPYIVAPADCGGSPSVVVGLGERVDATMHDGDGSIASGGTFLYVVTRQGKVDVVVQDAATFRPLFGDADLPSFDVVGVWLSADGFAVADVRARVDQADKRMTVSMTPDAARYQPGDQVTVAVTTIGPDGQPIAADVVLQGVDEKLYTLGQAYDVSPLPELFASTGSGIERSFTTHASPLPDTGGCGDGGGDGGRSDFRDAVTFQRITTDASGHGTATFRLSDDLTSWHLTATAVSADLDAGQGSVLIPVGLDFFAEPVLAPEYLAGDQPVLRIRGYGRALAAGDAVRYVVTSTGLGVNRTVAGTAFDAVSVELPTLREGRYEITIAAEATHAGRVLRDALTRTINVVPARLTTLTTSVDALTPGYVARAGGPGITRYVIADAGRGSLVSLLERLAASTSARFDSAAAADLARSLLVEQFGFDPDTIAASGFDVARYQQSGIALLPYASADLELSALAALTAPSRINGTWLDYWLADGAELTTSERNVMALAARAGLGEDVAAELQAIDPAALTIREQLWLGLGLAAAGDDDAARAIERDLLERHGQRLGRWVRLEVGTSLEDTLEGTGLMLVLAARLGDPLAADIARYLQDQPSKERVFALQLAAYAEQALLRLPRSSARFAYTVNGTRREVTLEPGASFTLALIPAEVPTLRLEPLEGKLEVVTSWQAPGLAGSNSPLASVTRTVTPTVATANGTLVRVTLTVTFGPQAPRGCYVLTDLLPSGLAPVVWAPGWEEWDGEGGQTWPYEVNGQRVSWCVGPGDLRNRQVTYAARVVTPGTYRWEPAVVQSLDAPEIRSATPETNYTIN